MAPQTLKVGYPLTLLRQGRKIVDPTNTEFVYEYFLLENMAVGLLRDSSGDPSGYAPGLAEAWRQVSPTRWEFTLRPDLRWSDGARIKPAEIVAHFKRLSQGESRHIVYLNKLKDVLLDGDKVVMEFAVPINDGIIHELSLADAALLHPRNLEGDWDVVSGPYRVESYKLHDRLVLKRNPHFAGGQDYPETVELLGFRMTTLLSLLESQEIDLLRLPPPLFRRVNQDAIARMSGEYRGHPTSIYFLYFNMKKPLWKSLRSRQELAFLVSKALDGVTVPDLKRETQFVPLGFDGRLESRPPLEVDGLKTLPGRNISIITHKGLAEATPLFDAMKSKFAEHGVKVEFEFTKYSGKDDDSADATLTQVLGNQKDALAGWKFLFSPEHGDLRDFLPEVASQMDAVVEAKDKESRVQALKGLHEHVLRKVYGVPLLNEPVLYLTSDRVDLSSFNRFDMRARFYEVRWR